MNQQIHIYKFAQSMYWHRFMYINAIFITGLDRHITTLKSLQKH